MNEVNDKEVGFETASQETPQEVTQQEPEQQTKEPEYLTREEVQSLLDAQKEDVIRQTQSLTDKASSRLDKKLRGELQKINEVIELQESAGIQLSAEQKSAMRQKVYDKTLEGIGKEPDGSVDPAQQVNLDNPEEVMKMASTAVIEGMVKDIYEKAGVTLMEGDPEAGLLDKSSPMAFLESMKQAVEKKKQRVQTAPETRITSLGKGTSAYQDEESIAAELVELQKNPTANKARRAELKKQLEELQKK